MQRSCVDWSLEPKAALGDGSLTPQDSQVLSHVAFGLSNDDISRTLSSSVETVKEHVQNMLRKMTTPTGSFRLGPGPLCPSPPPLTPSPGNLRPDSLFDVKVEAFASRCYR